MDSETLRLTNELLELATERLQRHPVLAAMATRVDVQAGHQYKVPGLWLHATFDGPALPKKQVCELFVPTTTGLPVATLPALMPEHVDQFIAGCEVSVAAEMKRAGLGV